MPKFADLADRYLEWMAHLAPTTQDDRRALLRTASSKRPEGALRAYFGRMPVDEIRKPLLLEWWAAEVEGRGRAAKTGRNHLDALSGVLALAGIQSSSRQIRWTVFGRSSGDAIERKKGGRRATRQRVSVRSKNPQRCQSLKCEVPGTFRFRGLKW